jgi:hypothetical protein
MIAARMRRPLPLLLAAACGAALAAHAWLGTYARYLFDDYAYAAVLRETGFWRSQAYWYTGWSGRYAFTFAVACAESIGPRLVPLLPALLIAVWSVVAVRSFRSAAALAAVYAAVAGAPDAYQSTLWQTGLLSYAAPLVLMTAWCGAWLRREDDRVRPADIVVPLLAGGFSETAAICNAIFFLLGALFAGRRRPFAAGAASALVALAIVAAAPGNLVRHALAGAHGVPLESALRAAYADAGGEIVGSAAQLVVVFAAAALVAPRRTSRRGVLFAVALVTACAVAAELASFAALGKPLPARALSVVHFFFVAAAAIWGAYFEPKRILVIASIAAPLFTLVQNVRAIPAERAVATLLDDDDARLRRGATIVPGPELVHGVEMFHPDPSRDSNRRIARYYGLPSVRSGRAQPLQDLLVHPAERPR